LQGFFVLNRTQKSVLLRYLGVVTVAVCVVPIRIALKV
jgi:hypothetical protein